MTPYVPECPVLASSTQETIHFHEDDKMLNKFYY